MASNGKKAVSTKKNPYITKVSDVSALAAQTSETKVSNRLIVKPSIRLSVKTTNRLITALALRGGEGVEVEVVTEVLLVDENEMLLASRRGVLGFFPSDIDETGRV